MQSKHPFAPMTVSLCTQILYDSSHFNGGRGRRHGLTKTHRYGIRDLSRQLPQKLSAFKTKDTAPNAIKMHRNNRRIDSLHNAFHPAPERKHLTDARHLSFGEDTDDFALLERPGGFAQRMNQIARSKVRCDWNHAHHLGEWFHQPVLVRSLKHQKANRTISSSN